MVEQVSAWKSSDGQIHPSKRAAEERDAYLQLEKLGIFNHASIMAVISNAPQVFDALSPLCIGLDLSAKEA